MHLFSASCASFPIIFSGLGAIPPASAVNYVTWAAVGFIFNYYIRRNHFSWWVKYNCTSSPASERSTDIADLVLLIWVWTDVLSAALDSGVAFSIIFIFFVLQYPKNGTIGADTVQSWWGNTVFSNTADGMGLPFKTVPEGSKFGWVSALPNVITELVFMCFPRCRPKAW